MSEIALDGHAAPVARVEGLSGDRVVSYAEDAIILWDSAPATAGEDEEEDNLQAMGGRVAGMCAIPLTSEGSLVAVWGGSFGNPGIEIWDPNTKAKLGWASGHT